MCSICQTFIQQLGNQFTTIMAVVSMIIAVTALYYSIKESRANKKHNRLSVLPHLTFEWRFKYGFDSGDIGIWLYSDGVGPAVICDFVFSVDNKIVQGNEKEDITDQIMNVLGIDGPIVTFSHLDIGSMIRPGYSEAIISIKYSNVDSDEESYRLNNTLKRMSLVIKYKSLYGKEFEEILNYKEDMFK